MPSSEKHLSNESRGYCSVTVASKAAQMMVQTPQNSPLVNGFLTVTILTRISCKTVTKLGIGCKGCVV